MTRVVVDTNVLVSFLIDRNPEQQQLASQLFDDAEAGRAVLTLHQSVLTELVFVLRNLYKKTGPEQAAILSELLALKSVEPTDTVPWRRVLESWPAPISDLTDAILATIAGGDPIATFDKRFARQLRQQDQTTYWP